MVFHAKQRAARSDQPSQAHPAASGDDEATEKGHRLERRCHEGVHEGSHAASPAPLPTDRAALLRQLSAQMQAIELGSELANAHTQPGTGRDSDGSGPAPLGTGWPQADAILRRGSVHDIFASLGAPLHPSPASPPPPLDDTPPLLILTHLAACALRTGPGRLVLWIGQRVWPSVHALIEPDDPRRLLLASSVLIDPPDEPARLWAIDLALRSPAAAAVIADARGLDLAATRRLQLAAASSRTAIGLLVRGVRDAGQLSAAGARWRVTPVPVQPAPSKAHTGASATASKANTAFPGRTLFGGRRTIMPIHCRPRLAITLEHCKGMQLAQSPSLSSVSSPTSWIAASPSHDASGKPTWIVEQSRGPLCVCVSSPMAAGCAKAPPDAPGHLADVQALPLPAGIGPIGGSIAQPGLTAASQSSGHPPQWAPGRSASA